MKLDIVRAWKDEIYRQSLGDEQLRALSANPAGELELTDADLGTVTGGVTLIKIGGINLYSVNILSRIFFQICSSKSIE